MKATIIIVLRFILIILGAFSLYFQLVYFLFSTFNRSSNDPKSYFWSNDMPHFFTMIIILWFLIYQVQKIMKSIKQ